MIKYNNDTVMKKSFKPTDEKPKFVLDDERSFAYDTFLAENNNSFYCFPRFLKFPKTTSNWWPGCWIYYKKYKSKFIKYEIEPGIKEIAQFIGTNKKWHKTFS